tara:strand:- start:1444 stop:1926 length:483 start_codon:yes stop_codon:yes gene_type:complete
MAKNKPLTKREERAIGKALQQQKQLKEHDLQREIGIRGLLADLRRIRLHLERYHIFKGRKQQQLDNEIWEVIQEGNKVYDDQFKTNEIIQHEMEGLDNYILDQIDLLYEKTLRLEAMTNTATATEALKQLKPCEEVQAIIETLDERAKANEESNKPTTNE